MNLTWGQLKAAIAELSDEQLEAFVSVGVVNKEKNEIHMMNLCDTILSTSLDISYPKIGIMDILDDEDIPLLIKFE